MRIWKQWWFEKCGPYKAHNRRDHSIYISHKLQELFTWSLYLLQYSRMGKTSENSEERPPPPQNLYVHCIVDTGFDTASIFDGILLSGPTWILILMRLPPPHLPFWVDKGSRLLFWENVNLRRVYRWWCVLWRGNWLCQQCVRLDYAFGLKFINLIIGWWQIAALPRVGVLNLITWCNIMNSCKGILSLDK